MLPSAMVWVDEGAHYCDSTLDAPLTLGVQPSLNWSLRQQVRAGLS